MSSRGKQLTLKSTLKNISNLAPAWTTTAPKLPRVACLKDLPAVSMRPFEAFCDFSFDVTPPTKSIEVYRSVLQELERAMYQIVDSAKIDHYALTLEKDLDRCETSPDASIKDAAPTPKFLPKLTKFFPQCKPKKGKTCAKIHFTFSESIDDIIEDL